jgi:hypothetical protein
VIQSWERLKKKNSIKYTNVLSVYMKAEEDELKENIAWNRRMRAFPDANPSQKVHSRIVSSDQLTNYIATGASQRQLYDSSFTIKEEVQLSESQPINCQNSNLQ